MDERQARFESQVLPHLDAAYRFARWLTHSPPDAEDLVQDAILRAYRGFDSLRGSDAKTWLMAIVRNSYYSSVRHRARNETVPLPDDADAQFGYNMVDRMPGPESVSILHDQQRTLAHLLNQLPEEQRTVLMLRELEEMSYAQIALITNVPIGTVMSRLARSRAALKSKWSEFEERPFAVR